MNICGECTLCCRVLPFTHQSSIFDKYNERYKYDIIYPPGKSCNKVCSTGCSIHDNKPKICKEFECDYILLELEEKFKPSNCGFLCRLKLKTDFDIEGGDEIWIHYEGKDPKPEDFYKDKKELINELIRIVWKKHGYLPVFLINDIDTYKIIL